MRWSVEHKQWVVVKNHWPLVCADPSDPMKPFEWESADARTMTWRRRGEKSDLKLSGIPYDELAIQIPRTKKQRQDDFSVSSDEILVSDQDQLALPQHNTATLRAPEKVLRTKCKLKVRHQPQEDDFGTEIPGDLHEKTVGYSIPNNSRVVIDGYHKQFVLCNLWDGDVLLAESLHILPQYLQGEKEDEQSFRERCEDRNPNACASANGIHEDRIGMDFDVLEDELHTFDELHKRELAAILQRNDDNKRRDLVNCFKKNYPDLRSVTVDRRVDELLAREAIVEILEQLDREQRQSLYDSVVDNDRPHNSPLMQQVKKMLMATQKSWQIELSEKELDAWARETVVSLLQTDPKVARDIFQKQYGKPEPVQAPPDLSLKRQRSGLSDISNHSPVLSPRKVMAELDSHFPLLD